MAKTPKKARSLKSATSITKKRKSSSKSRGAKKSTEIGPKPGRRSSSKTRISAKNDGEVQIPIESTTSSETPMTIESDSDTSKSQDAPSDTRIPTSNSRKIRKSLSSVKSVRSGMSVSELRRHLKSTPAGRTKLRSIHSIRRYVSEQEPFLKGQKFRNVTRDTWEHQVDSTFSLVAFAVDTANLARFPFFCFSYGGSAFLIPYFIFLVFSAFPLLYMELLLGQFVQEGVISVWKIVPVFRGIGYCICFMLILINSYYLSTLAWSMIFISESISSRGRPLPFTTCDNLWNTLQCAPLSNKTNHTQPGVEFFKGRVLRYYESEYTDPDIIKNKSLNGHTYFGFASDEGLGDPVVDLSLCLFFLSFCLFLLVISDIRITGKFVWLSSTLPFVILLVLVIETSNLKGAEEGIRELITPNFTYLLNPETWAVASIQVFYSTGAGFGVHLTHASHNKFRHNVFWDAVITAVANSVTSILGALVIFANIGNLAKAKNTAISEENTIGVDLIFESFSEGIGLLQQDARLSAILFYSLIFIIGFDTALGGLQAITTALKDEYPRMIRASPSFFLFTIIGFAYVFNLTSVTRGGIWMYNFMDTYAAGVSLILGIFFQTVVVTWIWGMDELCDAAIAMTGRTPGLYLRLCWKYISPLSLLGALVLSVQLSEDVLIYDGDELPRVGRDIGIAMTYLPFVSIPFYFFYYMIYYDKGRNFKERVRLCLSPETEHEEILANGIANARDRLTWKHFFFFGGLKYSPQMSRVSPQEGDSDDEVPSKTRLLRPTESNRTFSTDLSDHTSLNTPVQPNEV